MKTFLNSNFKDAVYVEKCNAFNTGLVDGDFPASASYIDVSRFARFAFLVFVGTLNSALTVKVQQATAANGTPKDITNATLAISATDDNKWGMIEVLTDNLDTSNDYKFVTLDVAGAAADDDFATIVFLGLAPNTEPVTQHASCLTPVVVAG